MQAKAQALDVKNQALELSHAILEELPIAVLGVDCDGVIVLANKMAYDLINHGELNVGFPIDQYFEKELSVTLSHVIDQGKPEHGPVRTVDKKRFGCCPGCHYARSCISRKPHNR